MKITFKKHPRSKGLAGIGEGDCVDVKLKGKKFGLIMGGSARKPNYSVQFAIKTEAHPGWGWKFLSRKHALSGSKSDISSLAEAKYLAELFIESFAKKYEIHFFEE